MEYGEYLRFLLALVFVLALIGLCARLGQRLGLAPQARKSRRDTARLSIVEVRPVDGKRKLMLIERDNVQHLLLIGGDNDLVVETAIQPLPDGTRLDKVGTGNTGEEAPVLPMLRRNKK